MHCRRCSRKGIAMSLTKEFFDHQAYLPDEPTNQLEFFEVLDVFKSQWLASSESGRAGHSAEWEAEATEIATPLSPLSNESFILL